MELLKKLCGIHAPSGNEGAMTRFLLQYIRRNQSAWKSRPRVFHGAGWQDCLVLVFGKPRTALMAHIDSIGYTVRYQNQLVKIGGPAAVPGTMLRGQDGNGKVACTLQVDADENLFALCDRPVEPGTDLTFAPAFSETSPFIESPYLDNRLGVWTALKTCETIRNGMVLFSCYEEHGGGNAGYLARFAFEQFGIRRFLVCDVTWTTEGVTHGNGAVVSLRDRGIPRHAFVREVRQVLDDHKFKYQVEVEASGGSDGTEIQRSAIPADWCFVGAPGDHIHTPREKVHQNDIRSMRRAYRLLMDGL